MSGPQGDTRILVLTATDEEELPGLDGLPDSVDLRYACNEEALTRELPQTDVLVVTDFNTDMLARAWPANPAVRWVHATSAGVDALMFPALVNSDIPVTNARGVFNRGIAEYVLGAVLLFAKDSLGNLRHQREHRWHHRETPLIRGARALVVGAGSIGRDVAGLLQAVDMTVDGTARHERDDDNFRHVWPQEKLPQLLPEADYVVITAPLTDETRGLFNRETLSLMRSSAVLINVGRGPIVRTDDLTSILQENGIRGAALDVFEQEPLPPAHPLWDMDNVMISAHMAGDFVGWRRALGEQFVENFRRWRNGESLHNLVDKKRGYGAGHSR